MDNRKWIEDLERRNELMMDLPYPKQPVGSSGCCRRHLGRPRERSHVPGGCCHLRERVEGAKEKGEEEHSICIRVGQNDDDGDRDKCNDSNIDDSNESDSNDSYENRN